MPEGWILCPWCMSATTSPVSSPHWIQPATLALRNLLQTPEWLAHMRALPGYTPLHCGEVLPGHEHGAAMVAIQRSQTGRHL